MTEIDLGRFDAPASSRRRWSCHNAKLLIAEAKSQHSDKQCTSTSKLSIKHEPPPGSKRKNCPQGVQAVQRYGLESHNSDLLRLKDARPPRTPGPRAQAAGTRANSLERHRTRRRPTHEASSARLLLSSFCGAATPLGDLNSGAKKQAQRSSQAPLATGVCWAGGTKLILNPCQRATKYELDLMNQLGTGGTKLILNPCPAG